MAAVVPSLALAVPERRTPGELELACGAYRLRLAQTEAERENVFRLRFRVFNLELAEGLDAAFQSGLDTDEFDAVCDHLLVEHAPTQEVVGTYRLQTGESAQRNLGYYSEREFRFAPYERLRSDLVELGRACIHREHRSFEVLSLLWKGVVRYAAQHGARYLIGCSSLTSQDTRLGAAMYRRLADFLAPPELRTSPWPEFAFSLSDAAVDAPAPPKLLRSYLAVGAKICGPPAIDREFKTIDFLTLMDLEDLAPSARLRFLGRRED